MSRPQVLLAFSGGLDTTFCLLYLQEQGYDVITATVNTGGFSEEEIQRIDQVSRAYGSIEHLIINAQQDLFQHYLRFLIYGNVLRGQVYPLSVSAERVCQAKTIATLANDRGINIIAHGSTASGNDQIRFDVVFRTLLPTVDIIAPIRSLGWSRQQEVDYLKKRGITIPPKTTAYSINEGMWGTSIGGKETLSSWNTLPDTAFPNGSIDSSTAPSELIISFKEGVPIALNEQFINPVDIILQLNQQGSRLGIGRGIHLGDTILGIKGRVAFEAPAAHLLIAAHRELEKLVLSGKQLFWKETLGNLYGSLLHESCFFDPLGRDLESFLTSSQSRVTGEVRMRLFPHGFKILGCQSPFSLMNSDVAQYGETNSLWTSEEAEGFAKIYGIGQQLHQKAGKDRL